MNKNSRKPYDDAIAAVSIEACLADQRIHQNPQPKWGWPGRKICILLIVSFSLVLLPLFVFMWVFNLVYFWLRNQPSINPGPYFKFDRHRIAHISTMDKLWCEYCEWANGTLQWTLAITNEIERRYCPIKNQCDPHCDKAKQWRDEFLDFKHQPEDLKAYYRDASK
ncbi:MAG: hypothetical protein HRU20_07075 [Pseudomonadales bacterium]|nr:hypothetical protein [Pseudomonadales bacterium]